MEKGKRAGCRCLGTDEASELTNIVFVPTLAAESSWTGGKFTRSGKEAVGLPSKRYGKHVICSSTR